MNIDIRQYLRTNPISAYPTTSSEDSLDCLLLFGENSQSEAYTQEQVFQFLYQKIFGELVSWYTSEGGDSYLKLNYDSIDFTNGTKIVINWGDFELSDDKFTAYVRRKVFNAFKDEFDQKLTKFENEVKDKLKSLKQNERLNYLGAVELQSKLVEDSKNIYDEFKNALGHIWCTQKIENIPDGEDRVELSSIVEHDHNETKAETMTESFTSNRNGGQLVGDFVIGNKQMISSDRFRMSSRTLQMFTPSNDLDSSYNGSLTYPLWGQNVIDWRNPDRFHNNMPPSCNIYIKYCDSVFRKTTAQLKMSSSRESVEDTSEDAQTNEDFTSAAEATHNSSCVKDLSSYSKSDLTQSDCFLRLSMDDKKQVQFNKQLIKEFLQIFTKDGGGRFKVVVFDDSTPPISKTLSMQDILQNKLNKELVLTSDFAEWEEEIDQRLAKVQGNIDLISEYLLYAIPRNYVGRIIISVTDDIESKVIAHYGGKHWRRMLNFLRGVEDDSAYLGKKFGEEFVCLRESNIPNHTHNSTVQKPTQSEINIGGMELDTTGNIDHVVADVGGVETRLLNYEPGVIEDQQLTSGIVSETLNYQLSPLEYRGIQRLTTPHNNMPPYKEVYIWECVELSDNEKSFQEDICVVTFDANGGVPSRTSYLVRKGSKLENLIYAVNPTFEGHDWKNWEGPNGEEVHWDTVVNEDITIKAIWKAKQYKITWHYLDQTKVSYVNYGDNILEQAPQGISKDGHHLKGWYQNETGSGDRLFESEFVTKDMDYYAIWGKNTIQVNFFANGGKFESSTDEYVTRDYEYKSRLETLPTVSWEGLQDNGYEVKFDGWYTNQFEKEQVTENTIVTKTTTYYAHWVKTLRYARHSELVDVQKPNDELEVDISYSENDAIASNFSNKKYIYTIDNLDIDSDFRVVVNAIVSDDINRTQRLVWFNIESGFGFGISNGKTLWDCVKSDQNKVGNKQLVPGKEYYWKLEHRKGTGTINCYISEDGINYENDLNGQLPISIKNFNSILFGHNPIKQGIEQFDFWGGSINLENSYVFTLGNTYKFKPKYCTIEFDAQGGSPTPKSFSIIAGSWVGYLDDSITKTNYTFNEWWDGVGDNSNKVTQFTNGPLDGSMTLYAHWIPGIYTITWDSMGGSSVPQWKMEYMSTLGELPTSTKTGNSFQGWFTTTSYTSQTDKNTKVLGDATYYAKWKGKQYVVTYDGQGGTPERNNDYVEYNATISTLPSTSRDGYTFKNWWTTTTGGEQLTTSTHITHDITYYAHWEIQKYTIKWDAQGGTTVSDWTNREYGSKLGTLPTTSRTGYIFNGWYTEPSSGTKVIPDRTVLGNATFYAHWQEDRITVQFNSNY